MGECAPRLGSRERLSHPPPAPAATPAATATTVINRQGTTLQPLQPSTGQTPQPAVHGTNSTPPYHKKQAPAHALWTLIHSSFAPSATLLLNWGTGVTPKAAANIPKAHAKAHRLTRHLAAQLRSAAQQECGGADVVVHIDLPASNTLVSNTSLHLSAQHELTKLR